MEKVNDSTITLAIIKAKILSEDSSEEVKRVVEIEWPSVKEVIKARMEVLLDWMIQILGSISSNI